MQRSCPRRQQFAPLTWRWPTRATSTPESVPARGAASIHACTGVGVRACCVGRRTRSSTGAPCAEPRFYSCSAHTTENRASERDVRQRWPLVHAKGALRVRRPEFGTGQTSSVLTSSSLCITKVRDDG